MYNASEDSEISFWYPNLPYSNAAASSLNYSLAPTIKMLSKPAFRHPSYRTVSLGKLQLRKPGQTYETNTKFVKPPANVVTSGATLLPHKKIVATGFVLPKNFCWSPAELTMEQNQGACGSCWAFCIAHMVADRVSVATKGRTMSAISTTEIMECSDYDKGCSPVGCEGNDPFVALSSLVTKNVKLCAVTGYPRTYTGANTNASMCSPSSCASKYYVTVSNPAMLCEAIGAPGDEANKRNVANMKQHIYNEGPIIAVFSCPEEFSNYDGLTIYEPPQGTDIDNIGRHAIEVVGWGKDDESGVEYWICRNSWGDNWPSKHRKCSGKAFFYMKAGSDVCHIESYAASVDVKTQSASLAPKDPDDAYSDSGANSFGCPYNTQIGVVSNVAKPIIYAVVTVAILVSIAVVVAKKMRK